MHDHTPNPNRKIIEVSEQIAIKADATAVWDMICKPCSLKEWHDDVDTCTPTEDAGRKARTYGMRQVGEHPPVTMYEVELLRSPEIMTIAYVVDVKGLPVDHYHAQITVIPGADGHCETRIRSIFVDADWGVPGLDPGKFVSAFYLKGLTKLRRLMEAEAG